MKNRQSLTGIHTGACRHKWRKPGMFTAMIIDDERIVREGIKGLIDWEKAGFRLGTCGKDGREG